MRKMFLVCILCAMYAMNAVVVAQSSESGLFNSLAVGVNAGTTGVGFDVATPMGRFFAVRAGVDFMPNIRFHTDVDIKVDVNLPGGNHTSVTTLDVETALKRVSGDVLLNIYPFPSSGFFLCGGAYFGGEEVVKISSHSSELAELLAQSNNLGFDIGDLSSIPVDRNGDLLGGLRVAKIRPYVGLGFGRAVPKKHLEFMVDLGAQIHGTPDIHSETGDLEMLIQEANDDITKGIKKMKVYPVLKFRLCGKLF